MRILILVTLYISAGLMPVRGQIVGNSIVDRLKLIDNKNVSALPIDKEVAFNKFKLSHAWKANATTNAITFSENNDGYYVPINQKVKLIEHSFTKLTSAPSHKARLYDQLKANDFSSSFALFSKKVSLNASNSNYGRQIKSIIFIYFYIFSLFTLFIFALVLWLRVRGKLYFYYSGYLFFLIIFGFIVLRKTSAPVVNFFEYAPELSKKLNEPIQFIFISFYIFFILNLLRVSLYDKHLARALKYLGMVCLFYAGSRFLFNVFLFDPHFAPTLFTTVRLIILPINLALIFWIIFKVKSPLLGYFIIGQSLFFIGAVLGSYISYSGMENMPGHFFGFKEASNIVFQLGIIGEVYCFSLALGKNVSLIQKDKERMDATLIKQFQENDRLQASMNRELDSKVREKTTDLIRLYTEIENEREEKIKSEFIQKIKETEMVALRSQMNPHFIFNSMNAIKNLIMTSRNEDAMAYLDDFSSLLRHILQNSNQGEITVEEELEILELYLSLEQSRLGAGFNYQINVTSREELSQYQIPPLLLQPIVENAIWHGLHPSLKEVKKLIVTFDATENLKIIIEDNGIGREESAKKKKLHTAMGTTLIRDRLALHNHLSDHVVRLEIADLQKNGRGVGTRVTLIYNMER